MAEDPPFNNALSGTVGIFSYFISTVYTGGPFGSDTCVGYDETFIQQRGYPSLATAQFCALLAPVFAAMGIFACGVDCCVCNFGGSFLSACVLFMIACGLQAGTFTLLADPAFCLEDTELECSTGPGAHMSIASTIIYAICSLLMCCAPRADPFCYNLGFGTPKRTTTTTEIHHIKQAPVSEPQIIVVQNGEAYEQPPASPTKSPRKKKKALSNKV